MRARVWLGQEAETPVRLKGADAPELKQGKCGHERALAKQAKDFAGGWIKSRRITIAAIQYDKYAGRVLACVLSIEGEDLGLALIQAGLARAYDGGKRSPWCVGLSCFKKPALKLLRSKLNKPGNLIS